MNAIITGAGGDIGGACARLLSATGANVLVVDADREAAAEVARLITEDGRAVALVEIADVDQHNNTSARRIAPTRSSSRPDSPRRTR